MKLRLRPFLAAVAVNLALVLLYLWSLNDLLVVTVRAEGRNLTATINGYIITAADDAIESGALALHLEDYTTDFAYQPTAGGWGGLGRWARRVADWIQRSNFPSAWHGLRVTNPETSEVLFEESFGRTASQRWHSLSGSWRTNLLGEFRPVAKGMSATGAVSGSDYQVVAMLARGKERAAITLRLQPDGSGYTFWFRPEHKDMGWERQSPGSLGSVGLAGGNFQRPFSSALKSVLRDILAAYLYAVLVLGILAAFAIFLMALLQYLPRPRKAVVPGFLRHWPLAAAVGLSLWALFLAVLISTYLLDRIPHVQDSVAYLFQARTFTLGRIAVPMPPLPEFFKQEFILVRDGLWFSKYPPGYPLVLALGVLLNVPWLVNPVLGAMSILLLYFLGRELYGSRIGLLAGVLGVSSPFFLFLAGSFMAHTTSLFFLTLFMLAFARALKRQSGGWALVAGFSLGFAFMIRQYTAALVAVPFAVWAVVRLVQDLRGTFRPLYFVFVGILPPVLFLLGYNWRLTGDPMTDPFRLWWSFDHLGFGPDVGIGGHSPVNGVMNSWHNLTWLLYHQYGWVPYLTLAFCFVPFITLQATWKDGLMLAVFLSVVVGYFFYWAEGMMYGPRYYYETLPALLLLTARGMQAAVAFAGKLPVPRYGAWQASARSLAGPLALAVVVGFLFYYDVAHYMPYQIGVHRGYNGVSGAGLEAVQRAGLKDALVFVDAEPDWQWWKYGAVFSGNSPLLDSAIIYARDMGEERNKALMTVYPQRSYYRLAGGRLLPLGK